MNGAENGRDARRIGKLFHGRPGENEVEFFKRIDSLGGWPAGMRYVSFEHTDARLCQFGNEYMNTGWWTTIFEADDFYRWKLSPKMIFKIQAEALRAAGDGLISRSRTMMGDS